VDRAERAIILTELQEHGFNVRRTAQALTMQVAHLYAKIRHHQIVLPPTGKT
jgi:DNA-binding NtrC family response regulator